MLKLSKHMNDMTIQIARKKNQKPDDFLLSLLLETYKETFKKSYLL